MFQPDADLIIIGGGPGGLTAAQYGARSNLRVLVIEQMAFGGQALLIDKLENYPGNTGAEGPKSGFDFSQDLYRQAEQFGAAFLMDTVFSIKKEDSHFEVTLGNGKKKSAYTLIIATGAKHRTLDIPGEKEFAGRGVSYCASCDGPFFKGKKMLVAGGGDAACDEAQYLSRLSPHITLIHRRDRFRAQKALADRVLKNPNIQVRFNTRPLEIRGDEKVRSVLLERRTDDGKAEVYEEAVEGIFIFVGIIPQTSLVPDLKTDENGYIVTDQAMTSSTPGIFAAGDVRSSPFHQVVVAAGEGAIAAHSAAEYIDRLKGSPYL